MPSRGGQRTWCNGSSVRCALAVSRGHAAAESSEQHIPAMRKGMSDRCGPPSALCSRYCQLALNRGEEACMIVLFTWPPGGAVGAAMECVGMLMVRVACAGTASGAVAPRGGRARQAHRLPGLAREGITVIIIMMTHM